MHVLCPHGHELTVDATRTVVACPRCGVVFEVRSDSALTLASLLGQAARPPKLPPSRRREADDDDEDERPRRKKVRARDEDDEDERPRRRATRVVEEEDEDEGEERKLTKKQRQLTLVRQGIMFHIIKLWIYLGALLSGFIFFPLIVFAGVAGGGPLALLVAILYQITVNLAIIVAPLAGIVGSALCLNVPPKSEARGTILVSLALDVLAPIMAILALLLGLGFLVTADDRVSRLAGYMNIGSFASTLIAWWLFMIFLRQLAFYMRETLMASEALNVITHLIVASVLGPALVAGTFMALIFSPGLFSLIMFIATVIWLIYFVVTFPIRMFRMLFLMRRKIWDKYLKPDDDDDLIVAHYGT